MLRVMQWCAWVVIGLGLAAGCGSVQSKADAGGDGNRDAPAQQDAPPAAACDVAKPFGVPIQVAGIHDANADDTHATLSADELTIFFASDRAGNGIWHIYSATRAAKTDSFGAPALLAGSFSTQGESHPSVSPDGNTIYYDSFRTSAGTVHIFTSTRSSPAVQFPAATMISGDFLTDPAITSDGSVLYAANLSTGGLVRLDRSGSGFGAPQDVALGASSSVVSPVTNDDLTMFMSFGDTVGGQIAMTRRTSTSTGFPAPAAVAELASSNSIAEPSWLSSDSCRLYLTYGGGSVKQTIFVATRPQ
jgi:hypothetical protein